MITLTFYDRAALVGMALGAVVFVAILLWDMFGPAKRGEPSWEPPSDEFIQQPVPEWALRLGSGDTPQPLIWDRGGVFSWRAPLPPEKHDCYVHTYGFARMSRIEHCACGAMCFDHREGEPHCWINKNKRREWANA